MTVVNKIDSNLTGLRYTREVQGAPGTLTGTEVWKETEPNSYEDFGSTITSTPRAPINASRQRKKGRVTDKEAAGGFQLDFTSDNMLDFMPGYFFADWRKAATSETVGIDAILAADDQYEKTGGFATALVGSLVLASGFGVPSNNGLKTVSVKAAGSITVAEGLADEAAPPAVSAVKVVGYQTPVSEVSVDVSDPARPRLVFATVNPSTFGLIPGQWLYVGGDTSATRFASAGNNGAARVAAISATAITLDKTQNTMVTEAAAAGKTIRLFFGDMIRNEPNPDDIKAYSYQFERKLSSTGYEYLIGSFPNELAINMPNSDKITLDLGFVALDSKVVEPGDRKSGTFPELNTDPEAFNTSSDFVRLRCSKQDSAAPLFGFIQEMTLNINNNITALKALAVLGAFDVTVGDFEVSGDITAYFNDIAAVDAVNNSDDLTLDFMLAFNNKGWVFDIPLFTGNDGKLNVEKDNPITIPLGVDAAEDPTLKTTMMACYFPYLPNAAGA